LYGHSFSWVPISQLRSVTCHTESHSDKGERTLPETQTHIAVLYLPALVGYKAELTCEVSIYMPSHNLFQRETS